MTIAGRLVLLLACFLTTHALAEPADEILGFYWFPDRTGQVEIFKTSEGEYSGRVAAFDVEGQLDANNPDPKLRNQPFVGSIMFDGFRFDEKAQRWTSGTIYDASDGKVYKCRLWFGDDESVLRVRGYIGLPMMGRTEEFVRVEGPNST